MTHGEALALAHDELRKHRWLEQLTHGDRREIEDLVTAVVVRVAETLEELDAAVYNAPTSSRGPAVLASIGM